MKNETLYKALCQMLPYGVKVTKEDWAKDLEIFVLSRLIPENPCSLDYVIRVGAKPYLRPLSDLTKEIEHEGENITLIDFLEIGDDENYFTEYDSGNVRLILKLRSISEHNIFHDIKHLPHEVVMILIKYKFDIWGLIESGDAIPVTEDNNPYK